MSRTGPALWYTYKGCSPQWALHLRDSQQTERKEQGRGLLRATEADRCTTVIQIAFIPVLQREMSGFVNVSYEIIVMSVVMGLNQKPESNIFVRGTSYVYFA